MSDSFYAFDHAHQADLDELKSLLGGKGAGLAGMTTLGIPVPPGFTIPTSACLAYLDGGWTDELTEAVRSGIREIERQVGRSLGDPAAPLLVSVRSGAALSMPGMMDTVLNAGMTEEIARGLETLTGDADFAWDTYKRALVSFAQVVLGVTGEQLAALEADRTVDSAEAAALAFGKAVAAAGHVIPTDPHEQITAAAEAVFTSWHSPRAKAYREREGIDHGLGTAATVQAMVFGNMGERSGTGVAFSRNPSTGEAGLMGDFLIGAQGEDVVAGTHQTMPLSELESRWPDLWSELSTISDTLEHDIKDMVDLEFTIEDGRLWLLQTRRAKRSPAAVFRTAVEMANDDGFPVDRAEAVKRCEAHLDDPPCLPNLDTSTSADEVVLATGLAASPGRSIGVVSLDPDDAVEREQRGERVILVRQETSPADVHGMAASVGLMTTLGGMVSHAAVVARSWGIAAVVGCEGAKIADDAIIAGKHRIEAGETITVCGDSGRVLLGECPGGTQPLPEVDTIKSWARTDSATAGPAPSSNPGETEVNIDDCLRLIVLKGMGKADALTESLGASEEAISAVMSELDEAGFISELKGGRYRPMPEGIAKVEELYEAETAAQQACDELLEGDFHPPNMLLKEIVTAWQMKMVDGEQVPNDHTDSDYDASVIARLKEEVHPQATPIIAQLSGLVPRFARYQERLEASVVKLDAGDTQYMAHPMKDSYHTVWFEMHEEMIKIAQRNRADEATAGRA